MEIDRRTTAEVEKTRCYINNKPYRNRKQRADARYSVRITKGTHVAYVPRSHYERCICGKTGEKVCANGGAAARSSRVK